MKRLLSAAVLFAAAALVPTGALADPRAAAGPYAVELFTEPAVIPVGSAELVLRITDSSGNPVGDAQVRVLAQMPGMPMGEREEAASPRQGQAGVYSAHAKFAMAGAYDVTLKIDGPKGAAAARIPVNTGQNTGSLTPVGASVSLMWLIPWIAGALVIVFVVYRMWKTGQKPRLRALLTPPIIGGILILLIVYGFSRWAVARYTKPGHMSVIESQSMDMSVMKPPVGAVPVAVMAAKRHPIDATVTYTGSAVAYADQDVYPRVTGRIVWMPLYPGDRVRRGQVIARLDSTELGSKVNEQAAMRAMAEHGTWIARNQYQQALATRSQSQSQVTEARNDLAGTRAEVNSAKQEAGAAAAERTAAQADLDSAQTGLVDAQAQVAAAKADQDYWAAEIKREESLLAKGVVSQQEYQQERAQAEAANSRLRQAHAKVDQANATIRGAQARIKKADRMAAASESNVSQAESRVEAARSKIAQAQANARGMASAAEAAEHQIEHSQAAEAQALAQLTTARVVAGYTELRAEVDGVVTQRPVAPGVLVNPGQAILRISQISPIRLQANVAESDVGSVRVGNRVRVRTMSDPKHPIEARVTSIFPAKDPISRTALVEALFDNKDKRFVPGSYLTMDISTGENKNALVVPAGAIVWQSKASSAVLAADRTASVWTITEGTLEKTVYTCTMHPEVKQDKPGKCPT